MIELISARLASLDVLKMIAGAADFSVAAETKPRALPAAFVLPLQETAAPNELGCNVAQLVTGSFGIALAVSNVADSVGQAAMTDLQTLRAEVRQALLGWAPDAESFPFEFGGGALLGFKNGVLWWQDVYVTQFLIKS